MKGYCTLNSDASVKNGVGGYAVWITTDESRIKHYGRFKNPVNDPNEAEMMAVMNGLQMILNRNLKVDVLVVNTDNQFCRSVINGKGNFVTSNRELAALSEKLLEMCRKFPLFYAKRIRGHTNLTTARHHVNRWCDEYARKGRLKND